jgi:phosphocarrier protein HPr
MLKDRLTVTWQAGVHLRATYELYKVASKFEADIVLEHNGCKADAQLLLAVIHLGICAGDQISVFANGRDEREALDAMRAFFSSQDEWSH